MHGSLMPAGLSPAGGLAALVFAVAVSVPQARAASFDCRGAALPAETAVCRDPNLSSLDDRAAGLYGRLVASAPAATVARVKQAQRQFLMRRNGCGAGIDCLISAYTDQLMFLRNEQSNLGQ